MLKRNNILLYNIDKYTKLNIMENNNYNIMFVYD